MKINYRCNAVLQSSLGLIGHDDYLETVGFELLPIGRLPIIEVVVPNNSEEAKQFQEWADSRRINLNIELTISDES